MKRCLLSLSFLLAVTTLVVAQSAPPIETSQLGLPIFTVNIDPATQANTALVGNPGPQTVYYWMVTNFTLGASSPTGPFLVTNAPNILSGSNYVKITPVYPAGILSIDLLKTSSSSPPTGACNCAVATGATSGTINDQSNSTSSYTVAPLNPAQFHLTITNEVQSPGVTHAILRQGGVFVTDLSLVGVGGITGATTGGGLVVTSTTLGLLLTCNPGQGLNWNGAAWVCASVLTNPMTTLGDAIGGGAAGAATRIAGPTSPNGVPQVLTSTPSGGLATLEAFQTAGMLGRSVTGTTSTDLIASTDCSNPVDYVGSVAVATSLPTPTTLGVPNCVFLVDNLTTGGATAITVTPTTWTCNGAASCSVAQGQITRFRVDPNTANNWVADIQEQNVSASTPIVITRSAAGITASCPTCSTGSGTANFIPKWSATSVLGNSIMQQWTLTSSAGSGPQIDISSSVSPCPGAGCLPVNSTNPFSVSGNIPSASAAVCATGSGPTVPSTNLGVCNAALVTTVAGNTNATGLTTGQEISILSAQNEVVGDLVFANGDAAGQTEIRGVESDVIPSSAGVTTARGIVAFAQNVGGTTTTNEAGYFKTAVSGTATNNIGVDIDSPTNTGTLTANDGLLIRDQNFGSGAHALRTLGTAPSVFGGTVSVGGLTSGDCLQASTGGLLTTTAAPCGTGTGGGIPNGGIDGSAGYVSGDPCATIAANLTTAVATNPQSIDLYLGNFAKLFTNGLVPCLSNPFENQVFSGRIYLGPIQIVKSVPWITPGNAQRVAMSGDGTSDPGVAIASTNSTLTDCDSEAPGWTGTNCLVNGITVPAFPSTGHCIAFTYPHGAFGAGTYCPSLWLGGMGPSAVTFGGSFGSVIQDFNIQSGSGGGNFGVYSSGIQEQSLCQNIVVRASNNAAFFFDKVQGNGSGPGHFNMQGCTGRMDLNDTAAQGYPNAANQVGMGYGIFVEGDGIVISASGGGCTTYPQAYPTTVPGSITAAKLTYGGAGCTSAPTCTVSTQHSGSGATCTWGAPSGGVVPSISISGGSGYSLGDTQTGGAFEIEDATINGKNTANMQEAVVLDGVFSPSVRSIHTGWDNGYGIHVGYGAGSITGGLFENNDLENTSNGVIRVGVGADTRQVMAGTGRGGSINSIQDDICNDSVATSTTSEIWSPCGNSGISGTNANEYISPYALDTGAANAYAITALGFPPSIQTGLQVRFKAANANTAASTLTVTAAGVNGGSSYGAINLMKRASGGVAALGSADLVAAGIYTATYDGTEWVVEDVSSAATALNIATAGAPSPSPAYSPAEGPTAVNPSIYTQDINGSWHQDGGMETTSLPANYPNSGPTGPAGTLLWTRRQYHRDTLLPNQVDKNTFRGFNHAFGVGTSQENQDSTIGSWQQNGTMTISGGTVSAGVVQFNVGQSGWIVPGQVYTPAGLATLTQLNNLPLKVTAVPSNVLVQLTSAPLTLHIANNASGGNTQYAGYINRGTNTLVGQTFVVAGFTNSANNGTFTCTANVATSITLNNPSGVSESPAITIIPTATAVIANVGQTSDTGTLDQYFYGLEGMQSELDVYGTPTFTSAVDGEVSTMSLQENALNPSNVSSPSFGYNVLRATATKSGAGSINGNAFEMAAVNAAVHINNIANNGGGVFPAIVTNVTDVVGGAPSSIGAGIYINFTGANRLTLRNYGVYTQDFSKSYTVTSVNNNSGGATVYNGTFPTTGALAGQVFKVTGFTNAVNNGTFSVNSNTTTTLTLANASGTAETKTVTIQDLNDWSIYSTGGQVYLGGNISTYQGIATAGNGMQAIYAAPSVIAIGSGTSIGSTSLCSTTACPAGLQEIHAYLDITTACSTTGTYQLNIIYTDDQGSKTITAPLVGTGVASSVLGLASTANYGQASFPIYTTGAASINYSTTAVACGTGGPMVGKMYLSVTNAN